jgi:hypothetical protein
MNLLTISLPGAFIFTCYLLVVQYVLRLVAQRYATHPWAQGLATLIH